MPHGSINRSGPSIMVTQFEAELGATLFERTSQHTHLTAGGEVFVHQAHIALKTTHLIPSVSSTGGVENN